MEITTPEKIVDDSAEILRELQASIKNLRRQIDELTEQARAGEDMNETAIAKPLARAKDMVAHCLKAENVLNECRNRQAGIARGGYALDLERARADIGCKLDRLRRCSHARPVSE